VPSDTGLCVTLFSKSFAAVVTEAKDEAEEPVELIPTLIPLPPDEVCICITRHFELFVLVTIVVDVI